MLALLLIASFLYYRQTTNIVHSKISDMAGKNISQTVGLFTLLLEGYDSVTKSLSTNNDLLKLLKEMEFDLDPTERVNKGRTITNMMGSIFYSRDDIVGMHVITEQGKVYSYEKSYAGVTNLNYASTDWFERLQASEGEMVWFGLSDGSVMNSMQPESVFVFGRRLFDLNNYHTIGYLIVETEPQAILAALSNVTISPNSQVYIVDKENEVIAATGEQATESLTVDFDELPRPVRDEVIADDRTDQLVVSANAGMAGWTVFGLTPKADISAEVTQIRQAMFVVILLLIALSTALATLVSRNISSPIKLLIREMRQVEIGNFRGSVNVNSFDEINTLVTSFNRMVRRIDELIERITSASISEKNAQLQALQSQVNPHFLYNTLDMIYWMLDERENDRLGRVILALSQMFRYSSDWGDASKTTLRHELDQMRHYMTIIENRLEGRIQTVIEVDERWLDVVLPKMTIQPIIENAVKSGIEPLGKPGLLRVSTTASNGELRITIEDNGVGIEETTLDELNRSLDGRSEEIAGRSRRGIGLPNVHRRIGLMYGEVFGLQIQSVVGHGTSVTILVPLQVERRKEA